MTDRQLGEIFFDGNVKLEVCEARNSISCSGCFYNMLVTRREITCTGEKEKCRCYYAIPKLCTYCRHLVTKNVKKWECHRNLVAAGLCQATFRDDGKSVIFVEVCG